MTEVTIILIAHALLVLGFTVYVYFPRKDRFDKKGIEFVSTPWDETEKKRDGDDKADK